MNAFEATVNYGIASGLLARADARAGRPYRKRPYRRSGVAWWEIGERVGLSAAMAANLYSGRRLGLRGRGKGKREEIVRVIGELGDAEEEGEGRGWIGPQARRYKEDGVITKNQRIHLMAELWPNACAFQGWNENDKARRYDLFARVLGSREPHKTTLTRGGHISANDFIKTDRQDDFGDVKRELLLLAAKDLRQEDPVRRTRLWIIRARLMPCYHIYKGDSLEAILRDRFKRTRGVNTIEDLPDGDLERLVFTLEARVNSARNEAGDSHHAMCDRAGVKRWKGCPKDCQRCAAERVAILTADFADNMDGNGENLTTKDMKSTKDSFAEVMADDSEEPF